MASMKAKLQTIRFQGSVSASIRNVLAVGDERVTMQFGKSFTFLYGVSGSGKSTISRLHWLGRMGVTRPLAVLGSAARTDDLRDSGVV
jgi:ABC-type proline/glycine betaine transport system ATPase subunit